MTIYKAFFIRKCIIVFFTIVLMSICFAQRNNSFNPNTGNRINRSARTALESFQHLGAVINAGSVDLKKDDEAVVFNIVPHKK
jgi:hypothetical protein